MFEQINKYLLTIFTGVLIASAAFLEPSFALREMSLRRAVSHHRRGLSW